MKQSIDNRIFWGLVTGFVAALIFAIGDGMIADQGLFMEAASKPKEFADFVTSDSYKLWAIRGLFGVLLEMYAFVALYLALRNGNSERLAFWALILFLVHIAGGQSLFAILYFMFPAIGQLYNEGILQSANLAAMEGDLLAFVMAGGIIWIIATILFAIAIWRDKTLPKLSGIVILVGFLLIDAPSSVVQIFANLIWGGAFLWLAISYRKNVMTRVTQN